MSQVSETLAAWREAERRLEACEDPDEVRALGAEVERLHEAYRRTVDLSSQDVHGHGEPSNTRGKPTP